MGQKVEEVTLKVAKSGDTHKPKLFFSHDKLIGCGEPVRKWLKHFTAASR